MRRLVAWGAAELGSARTIVGRNGNPPRVSILAVFLGALCLLWVGPVQGADKHPSHAVFALIMGVYRSVDAEL